MDKSSDSRIKEIDPSLLKRKGMVFDIQKFSIQDGPGIRTTVFMKGCPLHCDWCHNPESISSLPQLRFDIKRCIDCMRCIEDCSLDIETKPTEKAINDLLLKVNKLESKEKRMEVLNCMNICPSGALNIVGKELSGEDVLVEVIKDEVFYQQSGGGITLSGGEATMQPDFAEGILRGAKRLELHTVLDTCGYTKWPVLERLIPYTDLVLYDLKHMDEEKHLQGTRVSNSLILDNLKKLDKEGIDIWVRIPVIPAFNDSEENMKQTGKFLANLDNIKKIDLLGYHKLGENKYKQFGMTYKLQDLESPSDERLNYLYSVLENSRGI